VTVAFSSIGTSASGSTTVAPSYPASIASGDYLTCVVTSGATSSETPTTPTGWTLLGTGASTDGSFGVDTGPRRVTVFGRIADGTESGTLTVSITNGNTCRGSIIRWTKSALFGWNVVGSGGNDSTSGTGFSATTGAIDWAVGDCTLVAVGQRVDSATQSSQSLTATGITFGTRTNRRTDADTTGNDHRHVIDTFAATTAGTGSQAPTWAYTASASVSGGLVIVRLREVANSPIAGLAGPESGTANNATTTVRPVAGVAQATGTSQTPRSGRTPGRAQAVGVANNPRAATEPIHLTFSGGTPLTGTWTTPSFTPPANSKILVIGRASRENHLTAFNWSLTDSVGTLTWTKDYTATTWPNESSAYARSLVLFTTTTTTSPGSMTVTLDPWATADTGRFAAAVIILKPEQYNPDTLIGIGPAAAANSVSANETQVALGGPTITPTYAVFFSEDAGPNVTWATPPAGWVAKSTADTGVYIGARILRSEADADGSVQTSYTGTSAFDCAAIAFELNPWPYPPGTASAEGSAHNAGIGRYQTTADLVANILIPQGQVLAWMPTAVTATAKTEAGWEQGQFSTFVNDDTSPSYGHWYPNTAPTGPAYANADYNMVASIPNAFSGSGYVEHILTTGYTDAYATQSWRTLDQAGNELPATAVYSWRMKFHEPMTFDNFADPLYGFVQQFQIYQLQPVQGVIIGFGAGKRNSFDSQMRWYVDLKDRGVWDIAHVNSPEIPVGDWIHMEAQALITDQANGYLRLWQDGVIVIDYSGPTVLSAWTRLGCSWGIYGTLLTVGNPTNVVHVDFDECLISTALTYTQLLLPSAPGGMGDPVRAGLAQGTGTGNQAAAKVSAPAGVASGTGTAQTPRTGRTPGVAQGTGTARNTTRPTVTSVDGQPITNGVAFTVHGSGFTTNGGNIWLGTSATDHTIGAVQQTNVTVWDDATATVTAVTTGLPTTAYVWVEAFLGGGDGWSSSGFSVTVAVAGTNGPAGLAAGTGTGQGVTSKVGPGASTAPSTGTGANATITASGNTATGLASATGTGQGATSKSSPVVQASSSTGTASNATTASSGNTVTGVAAGSGTGSNATVLTGAQAQAQVASSTGTGQTATTKASGNTVTGVAQATGTGQGASGGIGGGAGPAAGTGTAPNATTKASGNTITEVAPATGTATNASISTSSATNAQAGLAVGTGTARDVVGRFILAGAATGPGSAADATVSVRVPALLATATGTAQGPTVVTGTLAAAGLAAGTGTGRNPATTSSGNANPGTATATGTATDPGVSGRTQAAASSGTGTAPNPTTIKAVAAQAGTATAGTTAYGATVLLARIAQAEGAFALGLGQGAVAYVVSAGRANAGGATARGAAYGAIRRPIFTGGLPVLLEPQTLTVITPTGGGLDGFGNTTWDYGVGATRRDIIGWIQQDQRTEGFQPGRDPLEESWLLITNDTGITGRDRIYWGAHPLGPITFEIEGPPEPAYRPGTGFHHTEATMRRLVG
jgi:hypothetical protein